MESTTVCSARAPWQHTHRKFAGPSWPRTWVILRHRFSLCGISSQTPGRSMADLQNTVSTGATPIITRKSAFTGTARCLSQARWTCPQQMISSALAYATEGWRGLAAPYQVHGPPTQIGALFSCTKQTQQWSSSVDAFSLLKIINYEKEQASAHYTAS